MNGENRMSHGRELKEIIIFFIFYQTTYHKVSQRAIKTKTGVSNSHSQI
jgi:hypothetical protein